MSEHFIKNIEIKNFKCFKDFKAEGFGRVNLIGGKNNVGKTAFMEALYLYTSKLHIDIYERLLVLKTYRNMHEMLLSNNSSEDNLRALILENSNIGIGVVKKIQLDIDEDNIYDKYSLTNIFKIEKNQDTGLFSFMLKDETFIVTKGEHTDTDHNSETYGESEEYIHIKKDDYSLSELINQLDSNMSKTKYLTSRIFIGTNLNDNELLEEIIGDLRLNDKYNDFNSYLHQLFSIENIDFIHKKPMAKINKKYQELSTLGEGIKSIIFYLGSLLTLENQYIFIDEIENGIHYTKLDELWTLILKISKQQNVQVFATTHSKECIESYNRVQIKLEDENSYYFEMIKNIKTKNHEVRGW
ncbi:FIG00565050: hypothetical protein [hydrothermal vent metagenome]|uniref:Endonuclease GajA/Old nuclease/RecF-like AAA domain-containing protein n=1 Tax=hydrothermal vent metagenome TaxID=652676 RepID=A0A1W1CFG3_9ZZZZ